MNELGDRAHSDDEQYLKQAVELAAEALQDGDGPFAALFVNSGQVLVAARNQTLKNGIPILHAEMVAIQETCHRHSANALRNSTLYSTCEPCLMCFVACFYVGVSRIVFAASIEDAIQFGSGDPPVTSTWLNEQYHFGIRIEAGPLRGEVISLFKQFTAKYGRLEYLKKNGKQPY